MTAQAIHRSESGPKASEELIPVRKEEGIGSVAIRPAFACMEERASRIDPRRCLAVAVMLLGVACPLAALAGPWEVGGTGVDSGYKFKLELGYKDTATQTNWVRPGIGFAAPLNSRLSYEIAVGHGAVETSTGKSSGMRDLDAKIKWKLQEENGERNDLAWLLEPKLTLPTGDKAAGISGDRTSLELPLRAGKTLGKIYLTGEVRYTHVFDNGYDQLVGYGGLVEYFPSSKWVVGVDLITDMPVDDSGLYHLRSNAGIKWKPGKSFELQGLLGRSITNRRGLMTTSAKVVAEFKF